jgi:hypothetical protein
VVRFTDAEVIEVWDRWQAGEANRLIGRDLGRSAGSIRAFVESWGGVRPAPRRRSERHLSLDEREEISRSVVAGDSLRSIAVRLGRSPSTISRGLARNGGRGGYRAHREDRTARRWARRPKPSKLAENPVLRQVVEDKLEPYGVGVDTAASLLVAAGDNPDRLHAAHTSFQDPARLSHPLNQTPLRTFVAPHSSKKGEENPKRCPGAIT